MRALFLLKIIEHNFPAAFPAQNPKNKNENCPKYQQSKGKGEERKCENNSRANLNGT
jgi:hypothetical protein